MLYLSLKNETDVKLDTNDESILKAIKKHFTHFEKNYFFNPYYQSGGWDGKASMFNSARRILPYGLLMELLKFLKKEEIDFKVDDNIKHLYKNDIKLSDLKINYDLKFQPRDYQKDCIEDAVSKTRGVWCVSTGGGKSIIISYIIKILNENKLTKNHLIIVPTISLIKQFHSDLIDYGFNKNDIGSVNKDKKEFDKKIVISTWQSLMKRKDELNNFDFVCCDEVHISRGGKEIMKIMKECKMKYKIGVTGTLPDHPLEKMRVISYIGPVWKHYKSKDLAEDGYLSDCNIKQIKIKYKNSSKFGNEYHEIRENVFNNDYRLKLIKAISNNLDTLLILVERVEKEGEILKDYLSKNLPNKKVVFISGKDNSDFREEWRKKMETEKNIILIATYGVFSTGINIKALNNILIASSSKSKIRILQSIGRSLRLHKNKEETGATIWDICDQVKILKRHGNSREKFYDKEEFPITSIEMDEKKDKNLNKLFE